MNVLFGRQIQEQFGQEKQVVLLLPLIEGLDGKEKMSKSKNNYIGIDEMPNDIFGKTMSIPDELLVKYFELTSNLTIDEVSQVKSQLENGTLHPKDAKTRLAYSLVEMLYDKEQAEQSKRHFSIVFENKQMPDELPEVFWDRELNIGILDLVKDLDLLPSKSEVRKMVKNGGIRINQEKITNPLETILITEGTVVQVGKRKFVKLKLKS
ncbi:tyrosine--tRNA ligase [Pseudalkalibacillus hwajinpoensis]|uniref:tyrosine--tRNA ligase n=1 Tax=Guptibacillus hwajinpoensis TaxID=208199 RepID=UPI00325B8FEA